MVDTLEELKKQHFDNYKKSIFETIENNTNVLVDEDIMSLLRKPPLDSMDLIKMKYLDLAKKNKVVVDAIMLDKMLDEYRGDTCCCCETIKKIRVETLKSIIDKVQLVKETDTFKINKKDFNEMNKKIKRMLKDELQKSIDEKIISSSDLIFSGVEDASQKKKIGDEIAKFSKGSYLRQLLENIDFKILVKDTTLSNSLKEQGERYIFTLANSRIFKQEN